MMHVSDPPEPPRKRNPRIPAELEKAILKLLEKDPANRYQSCGELAADLLAIRQKRA
jgi:serine/threonine protein kinase